MADIVITGQMKKADGTSVPVEITIKETPVVVVPPAPPPAPVVSPAVITSLVAGNDNIPSGAIVELKWATTGAVKTEIIENTGAPVTVAASGSRHYYPKVTSVYKLRATNAAGAAVEKAVTVNVQAAPPVTPPPPAPPPVTPPPPAPPPVTPPAPAPSTGTALPNDIVDANGAIVPSAWDDMIAAVGTDKWADYRFGKAATNTTGGTKFYERPHKKYPNDASNAGQRNSIYEFGSYQYEKGDSGGAYSTSQIDVATFHAASGSGIISLQSSGYTNGTGQLSPQPQWQRGYETEHANIRSYKASGVIKDGDIKPLFIATANDQSTDNGPSRLVVCADGTIIGVGSNTASNVVSMKLPAGKVPVAGCITVKAEFLYVVVWDKATRKTQVAVIILAGLAEGNKWNADQTKMIDEDWWQEWRQTYPGLPNRGNTAFMKLLGFVDTGLSAGTCAVATTGMHPWEMIGFDGGRGIGYQMSPVKDHIAELRDGGKHGGKIARGGLLAVGSKSEKKVALLDLKGLHAWIYDSYYGINNPMGQVQNLGMGDNQWPQVLSVTGVKVPVVKTLSFDAPVADMRFTGTQPSPQAGDKPAQLWVCTTDGTCHIVHVGDYVPGTKTGKVGQPSMISVVGKFGGLGPVSTMATMLGMKVTGNVDLNTGFWFVCRSTREIGYARISGTSGTVPLKYVPHADQCLDPVSLGDVDNYSNEANSQIVCDYNGKRVSGFRTDVLRHNGTWTTWPKDTPVQATNGIKVEFNGAYATPGKPVHLLSANVP